MKKIILLAFLVWATTFVLSAQNTDYRPGIFFKEDWSENAKRSVIPLAQKHVENKDLLIQLYGAGKDSLSKSHHAKPLDDPFYVWSGKANGKWMVSLKHKTQNIDLSGYAKIRMRTKQSGFRLLRITLQLADETWLISSQYDDNSKDWRIREFILANMDWYYFDENNITETRPALNPDLENVIAVGFTDLMDGGGSSACSRIDWIEVYGLPVKRQ